MAVFVLDRYKKPLMPCSEKRARKLLASGRARVHRYFPFSIRLIDRVSSESTLQPIVLKFDPGSKVTGIALVRQTETLDRESGTRKIGAHVLCLFELIHRGQQISKKLALRRQSRRRRRSNLRYRAPRFLNRRSKKKGWLPPSLQHRVDSTRSWARRLCRLAPVSAMAQKLVCFDLQKLENPEIAGIEYQHGTLGKYRSIPEFNRT